MALCPETDFKESYPKIKTRVGFSDKIWLRTRDRCLPLHGKHEIELPLTEETKQYLQYLLDYVTEELEEKKKKKEVDWDG